jgi:hypothetical protein
LTGGAEIERELLEAVAATRGHFVYESGHHGDLWLDLDGLQVEARRLRVWAAEIGGLHGVPFFTLASLERKLWQPAECPLCAAGTPFDPGGYGPATVRPRVTSASS